MAGKPSPRKLIFFIILTLFLMAGFSISTYYYIMGRYTDQIVGMVQSVMQDFTSEELETLINDEELLLALNEWQESKNELDGLLDDIDDLSMQSSGNENADNESDTTDNPDSAGSEIDIQNAGNNSESDSESSNNNSNNSNSGSGSGSGSGSNSGSGSDSESVDDSDSRDSQNGDNKDESTNPAEDDSPPSGTPDAPQEIDGSLANKLTAQDTVFILQVYRKFSASERDELKSLYAEGGNNDLIKEKVKARLTPDEIEKSIEIALRILN